VVAAPVGERASFLRVRIVLYDGQRLGGVQDVPFQAGKVAAASCQSHALLRTKWLNLSDVPFQAAGGDLDPNR
jgi:hypothetical protein